MRTKTDGWMVTDKRKGAGVDQDSGQGKPGFIKWLNRGQELYGNHREGEQVEPQHMPTTSRKS
jgi:hypothetical protein